MNASSFKNAWRNRETALHHFFPENLPLGWRLRTENAPNWLRFYSLPDGDLPKGTEAEIAQVLIRFERLSQAIYENRDTSVCIVSPVRKFEGKESQYRGTVPKLHGLSPIQLGVIDETDERGFTFDLYGTTMRLSDPGLTAIVTDIAKDRIMQSIICSDAGDILSPYEGGFDVIAQDFSKLKALKTEFREWQSTETTGL